MKIVIGIAVLMIASSASAAECVTNLRGQTVCGGAAGAVVVHPQTGTVTSTQVHPSGVMSVQSSNGSKAAYNPNTGNAAVSQKNSNGVQTTQTSRGGKAKTKNGMGVAQGPGGTTCAKGQNTTKCR